MTVEAAHRWGNEMLCVCCGERREVRADGRPFPPPAPLPLKRVDAPASRRLQDVQELVERGLTDVQIAERLHAHPSAVQHWRRALALVSEQRGRPRARSSVLGSSARC